MKALIPSHRENKRYLKLEGNDLKKIVPAAIKEAFGFFGLSEISLNWIFTNKKLCNNINKPRNTRKSQGKFLPFKRKNNNKKSFWNTKKLKLILIIC
jgi:uncharacterized protein YcgL (UPF0745 family)